MLSSCLHVFRVLAGVSDVYSDAQFESLFVFKLRFTVVGATLLPWLALTSWAQVTLWLQSPKSLEWLPLH